MEERGGVSPGGRVQLQAPNRCQQLRDGGGRATQQCRVGCYGPGALAALPRGGVQGQDGSTQSSQGASTSPSISIVPPPPLNSPCPLSNRSTPPPSSPPLPSERSSAATLKLRPQLRVRPRDHHAYSWRRRRASATCCPAPTLPSTTTSPPCPCPSHARRTACRWRTCGSRRPPRSASPPPPRPPPPPAAPPPPQALTQTRLRRPRNRWPKG